jgi:hypothetical protein
MKTIAEKMIIGACKLEKGGFMEHNTMLVVEACCLGALSKEAIQEIGSKNNEVYTDWLIHLVEFEEKCEAKSFI